MNKSDDKVKEWSGGQAGGFPEQEKVWQPPRLTVWQVAEDTAMAAGPSLKTASGADSQGMRDVTPP